MKKLFVILLVVASSFTANTAYSQVHVNAHIGIGLPAPVVVYENDYPGYTYYEYPSWRGHYRDHYYYEHYHPRFEREHSHYFNGRHFDHDRYEHDRGNRGRGHNQGDRQHSNHDEHHHD